MNVEGGVWALAPNQEVERVDHPAPARRPLQLWGLSPTMLANVVSASSRYANHGRPPYRS